MYCLLCAREGIISAAPCGRSDHGVPVCLATAEDIATDVQRRLRGKAFSVFESAPQDGENDSGSPNPHTPPQEVPRIEGQVRLL